MSVQSLYDKAIAIYHFNSTWNDSKNGHNGTADGATFDTVNQKLGSACASFDGNNDSMTVSHHADFNFGTGDFAVAGWLNPDNGSGNGYIFTKDDGLSNTQIALRVDRSTGLLGGWVGGTNFEGGTDVLTGFHSFVLQRVSGDIELYVDDASDMVAVSGAGNVNTSRDLIIGAYVDSVGTKEQYYKGLKDELVFFNDSLTSGEISDFDNSGAGVEISLPSGNLLTMRAG